MSVFFDGLRHMLSRHFTLREESIGEEVIGAWRAMGLDLTRERALTMHVLLPSEDAAAELGFRAETLPAFLGAQVRELAPQEGFTAELSVTFKMRPEAELLDTLERLVCALGSDLDARADGWSSDAVLEGEMIAA